MEAQALTCGHKTVGFGRQGESIARWEGTLPVDMKSHELPTVSYRQALAAIIKTRSDHRKNNNK